MPEKPAEISINKMAGHPKPSAGRGPMNVLVAGIPTQSLLRMIRMRYPGELILYVAESRPYEMQVARAIAAISATGISVSIVTDNMMAALFKTVPITAVWSQYMKIDDGWAVSINGAYIAALLAKSFGIPCFFCPIYDLPAGEPGRFAGEDITVSCADCMAWEPDIVPMELITGVVEHG